jgi:hypothetical protein
MFACKVYSTAILAITLIVGCASETTAPEPRPWADVRSYGARGDGSADDTAAIEAAINSLANGESIYFPPGIYRITSTVTLTRGVRLVGDGRSSIIRTDAPSFNLFEAQADYLSFEGLAFEGAAGDDSTRQFAIHTTASHPARWGAIFRCYFGGPSVALGLNNGVVLDAKSDRWNIENNLFEYLVGHDGAIGNGYGVLLGTSNEHRISSNRFLGDRNMVPARGRHAIYASGGASNNMILNNYIQSFNSSSIVVYSRVDQASSQFNLISNNLILDQARGETGTAGIELSGKVENALVARNMILNSGRHGIVIEDAASGGGSRGNRLDANNIYQTGEVGILIAGAKDAEVIGNRVIDSSKSAPGTHPAIHIMTAAGITGGELADRTLIIDNTLSSTNASPYHRSGIKLNETIPVPTSTTIVNNRIRSGAAGDIEIGSALVNNAQSATVPGNLSL